MTDELSKKEEETDWYGVLEVDVDASEKVITKSFKRMSLVWHPDKNGGSEEAHARFMKIKDAQLFLLDGKKRKLYDQRRAARLKTETLLAERNRSMGKRQRELRAELERREKEAANGSSSASPSGGGKGGLGAGGEARVAAAKLDELRKQGEAERQRQSADWSAKSASAKKRRVQSSGLSESNGGGGDGNAEGLEERTLRVKWKSKRESHSDYTLDAVFSRFGVVQSVSIEEGKGDRALVVFASAASADAAMAVYGDRVGSETMRTSYIGKRRPKRSAFAPRRQTMSPKTPTPGAGAGAGGGGAVGGSLRSFRDHESIVMMNLRKEAERQALMRKMAEDEGLTLDGGKGTPARTAEGGTAANVVAASLATRGATARAEGGVHGVSGATDPPGKNGASVSKAPGALADPREASEGWGDVAGGPAAAPAAPAAVSGLDGRAPSGQVAADDSAARGPGLAFPVRSPMSARVVPAPSDFKARRKSEALFLTMTDVAGGNSPPATAAALAFGVGSRSVPTTPVSGRGAAGQAIDESDILARMMAMKR